MTRKKKDDAVYNRANEAYGAGLLNEAISALGTLSTSHLDYVRGLNDIGALYYVTGDYERAEKYFRDAAARDKRHYAAKINLMYLPVNDELRKIFTAETSLSVPPHYTSMEPVSIVIPAYNKWNLTKNCLKALKETAKNLRIEIIIIDNSSNNETQNGIQEFQSPGLTYVRNMTNVGFSRACNQGAKIAKYNLILFLNNDTVPLRNWLHELLKVMRHHPDAAVAGSKLLYENKTVQHAGVCFSSTNKCPVHIYRRYPEHHPAVNKIRAFQAVTAACLIVRRNVFLSHGMFDERYLNGYEDVDFCLKVSGKGHKIIYHPQSTLFHLEGQSEGRTNHENKNFTLFWSSWSAKIKPDELGYVIEDNVNIIHTLGCPALNLHELNKLLKHLYGIIVCYPELAPEILLPHVLSFKNSKAYRYFYDMAGRNVIAAQSAEKKLIFLKAAMKCAPHQLKNYGKIIKYAVARKSR